MYLHSNISTSVANARKEYAVSSVKRSPVSVVEIELEGGLQAELSVLARMCSDAVTKSVQHYRGDDLWLIGTLPGCILHADALENRLRALLTNSQVAGSQVEEIAEYLKTVGDLRSVARAARQVSQLYWLLKDTSGTEEVLTLVRRVGEAAAAVAEQTAVALERGDAHTARRAALLYRDVDVARFEAERELVGVFTRTRHTPLMRRLARAAVWFMAVGGEGMARVAARCAQ